MIVAHVLVALQQLPLCDVGRRGDGHVRSL
jgi:hypothetical protein